MKKIATATIATAGIVTFGFMQHDADAAENNNNGYNPNDPYSYSYTYTIDQQGNYHYNWQGNWSPNQAQQGNNANYSNANQGTQNYNSNNYYSYNYNGSNNNQTQSYQSNNNGGGLGASYSTSDRNVKVTTQSAPTQQSSNHSSAAFSGQTSSGSNLYTSGQCTYYVFDKVGGKIGSTWGNANNWANAAAQDGYTVNNKPKQGAVMQTSQGVFGHVAYVENVNSDGSVKVSEMNYNGGPGVVSTRTISASQASSYNYIS